MPPFDPDDLIVIIDNKTGKVIGRASSRNKKRTERAQQMDEETERARTRREQLQLKKVLAAEASRSQPVETDDQFVFGPAEDFIEPTYTGDDALDSKNFEASRAKFLLRKIEYFLGDNLSPAWQRGELSLADLEAKFHSIMEGNSTPALPVAGKGKGKGRAAADSDEGRPSNYDGITYGKKAPADTDSSDDDSHRVHKSESQSVSRNKPAPTAARSAFSPLTSTDSSTLLNGKMVHYPQNLPPDARIHVPPTCATVPDSPPPRKKSRHVPPPSSKPSTTQPRRPSGSLKISSFGPTNPRVSQSQPSHVAGPLPTLRKPCTQDVDRVPPAPNPDNRQQATPPSARRGHGTVGANSSSQSRAGHTVQNRANVSANASGPNGEPGGRNPPARVGQATNAQSSRNPRAGQAANACPPNTRPNVRVRTLADADEEVRAAMDEGSDAEPAVDIQGMPTDPRVAILHGSKAILASFAPSTHPTLRFMRRRAKAQVISVGSYNWEPSDPGVQYPTVEEIVTHSFAVASEKMRTNYPFLMEHVLLVETVVRTERSNIKRALEPIVIHFFTFSTNPVSNRKRSRDLLPNAFHQLQTPNGVVPFGNPYIREACRVAVFNDKLSLGIQYSTYFNPLSWRFLAFIATITNHIIHSWRDGHYKREKLDVTQQLPVFRRYLQLLEDMYEHQPNHLDKLCGSIHDDARARHEQTLEKSPTPEPPVEWAPDSGERYVPRFANHCSASEGLAQDEQIGAADGEDIDARDSDEHTGGDDEAAGDDERAGDPGPSRGWGTAEFESQTRGAGPSRRRDPGPSRGWGTVEFESQTKGAGPSRHQYRDRQHDDIDDSDVDLPAPGQILSGSGGRDSAADEDEDPPDAEAAEYSDERERGIGEEMN